MKSTKLLVPADKTANFYKMDTPSYNVLLHKNITKTYKKVNSMWRIPSNSNLNLSQRNYSSNDRINTTAKREVFITLKDHKPTCRLINPTKAEIGKVSKRILGRMNTKVVHTLQLNQWKNTKAVLNWFNSIQCKAPSMSLTFIHFY